MQTPIKILSAFIFSSLLFYLLFPWLIEMKASPLFAGSWLLADSSVSLLNFIPSFDVIRYEILENSNFLWTNLRGMGAPLLGNEIMTGPLFPLTLLLIWLPGDMYWNVFVCSRVILAGVGVYLLARDFLKLKPLPALFFMFSFAYSLYVIRWMNHPWQNGFLAGTWYLYVLVKIAGSSRKFGVRRFFLLLSLVVAVFSMVTCGFPTTSAFFGLLIILVYIPYLVALYGKKKIRLPSLFFDITVAHLIGFSLASYQIFSILELFILSSPRRTGVGLLQFPLDGIFTFFSIIVSNITSAEPQFFSRSQTSLGLLSTTLFIVGIYALFRNVKRISYADVGALACLVFFMLKLFPLWPWFNTLVGSTPVLAESRFRSYFYFCFLWFLAYFVAKGTAYILREDGSRSNVDVLVLSLSGCVTLLFLAHSLYVLEVSFSELFSNDKYEESQRILWAFGLGFLLLLITTRTKKRDGLLASGCVGLVFCLCIYEQIQTLPAGFYPAKNNSYITKLVDGYLLDKSISKVDYRERSYGGAHVGAGIATINNGAPTLVPSRSILYRNTLFESPWGGMMPISQEKTPHSWQVSSAAFFSSDFFQEAQYSNLPQWEKLQKLEGGRIKIEKVVIQSHKLKKGHTLLELGSSGETKISGWAVDPEVATLEGTSVFVVLAGAENEIVAPVRVKRRRSVVKYFKNPNFKKSGWEVYFDDNILKAGTYFVYVRFLRPDQKSYYEKESEISFTIEKGTFSLTTSEAGYYPIPKDSGSSSNLVYLGRDGKRYLYKDESVLSRAYIASRCIAVTDKTEAARYLKNGSEFQLGDVLLENLTEEEFAFCTDYKRELEGVPIVVDKGSEVQLSSLRGPAIVVLSDNYYPGWYVQDDKTKEKLEISPVNIALKAVILPEARDYTISFLYRPPWLYIAHLLIGFSGLFLFFLALYSFRPGPVGKRERGIEQEGAL